MLRPVSARGQPAVAVDGAEDGAVRQPPLLAGPLLVGLGAERQLEPVRVEYQVLDDRHGQLGAAQGAGETHQEERPVAGAEQAFGQDSWPAVLGAWLPSVAGLRPPSRGRPVGKEGRGPGTRS
jgi:hypothetical protein